MATIKSFTSLEQSKKLAEILPLESADMVWEYQKDRFVGEPCYLNNPQFGHVIDKRDIACWSLAALLGVLPEYHLSSPNPLSSMYCCRVEDIETYADNQVDVCVAMIEYLHELKLL